MIYHHFIARLEIIVKKKSMNRNKATVLSSLLKPRTKLSLDTRLLTGVTFPTAGNIQGKRGTITALTCPKNVNIPKNSKKLKIGIPIYITQRTDNWHTKLFFLITYNNCF